MHRRFRRACTALADSISTATDGLSELDLMVIKATTHDDVPLAETHVWELATVLSSSPPSSHAFLLSFTRRFGRTRSWRVALKCLLLLHRLLRTLPSDHPFRADVLRSRTNSLISLHTSAPNNCATFVRSYARLLDEVLTCPPSVADDPPSNTFTERMVEAGWALELLPQLQSVMDRAMECRPAGEAGRSLLVRATMKQVARESFACYSGTQKGLLVVLDALLQMPHRSCIAGLAVYKRAADQAERLGEFYHWCRRVGVCGPYEYPLVEKIPKIHVRAMESFVERIWQMTESSSSSSSPQTSSPSSSALMDVGGNKDVETVREAAVVSAEWEKFEEESVEEEPLIQFGDDDEPTSWEVILEASVDRFDPWWTLTCGEGDEELIFKRDDRNLQGYSRDPCNPFFDQGHL